MDLSRTSGKQKAFFEARTRFVAYGGARGGGKSWAVRQKAALMALNYPGIRLLILRRTYSELRENHILPLLAELYGAAKYKESEKAFTFPNGSRLRFGYCDGETDVLQYQGQEYDAIFMDEATQFTEYQFQTLTACLRGANSFPKRFYLTCNPGGVGHAWVKRLFVTQKYENSERPEDYTFIRASVKDNQVLVENDPEYVRMLENLPGDLRRAWLEGDWDVFQGQYFTEFRENLHVMEPFALPEWWRRYFTMDYGLDMFAAYWIAMDNFGRAYVYREAYKSNLVMSDAAALAREMTGGEKIEAWFAPPDMWNRRQDTGGTVADAFAKNGIPLVKASNNRAQGWLNVKEWLKPGLDEAGLPCAGLRIFRHCANLIESFPPLQVSQKDPNDCDTEPHRFTHGPDAIRYFVAGRPYPAALPVERDEDAPAPYQEQVNDFLNFGA
nr:MAG: terminase large subunit [Caudoviricetes sp.]